MASVSSEMTVVGNVGGIYELRRVGKDKKAVIDFSIAVTPRVRQGDEWKDGETTWISVTAWEKLAENIEKSFNKGDRVFVKGRTSTKPEYTKDDGTVIPAKLVLTADYAGLEIAYDSASSDRVARSGGGSSSSARSSVAPAAKKAAPKKVAAVSDDDFDLGLDDDEDAPF